MVFVESPLFSAWRQKYLAEDDFRQLQNALLEQPDQGDVIVGSGGLRKMRIAMPGRGKSGGARVIYYYWQIAERIYLLHAYAKNQQADLTPAQIKQLAAAMRQEWQDG